MRRRGGEAVAGAVYGEEANVQGGEDGGVDGVFEGRAARAVAVNYGRAGGGAVLGVVELAAIFEDDVVGCGCGISMLWIVGGHGFWLAGIENYYCYIYYYLSK